MATLAAHQPNFCPDSGFFDKMRAADIFVLLNHVQFEKNNYQNRFKVGDKWYTMRVSKKIEPINQKYYLNIYEDWEKIQKEFPVLSMGLGLAASIWTVADMNCHIIQWAVPKLGMKPVVYSDYYTELSGTDRLIHLCQNWKADTYLSGPSGRNYLELDKFEKAGIKVEFFEPQNRRPLCEIL